MPRYKLTLEYNGTYFNGFQRQKNVETVQQTIEEALFQITREQPVLHAAGRTDTGVHAKGQVVHVDLLKELTADKLQFALNHFIYEKGISVLAVEIVDVFFHARFYAKKRYYQYHILNQRPPSPLLEKRAWHIIKPLDISSMKQACSYFIGTHDFSAFRFAQCQSQKPIKTMDTCSLSLQKDNMIHIDLASQSFLHNQVRIMIGTLVDIGMKKYPPEYIQELLEKKDRTKSGPTAPPYGLYFMKVDY